MNPLEKIIRAIIAAQGMISIAAYMQLALQHPDYGYYRVREPLGRAGDFITAPEISQLFGEMIGVWCAESWRAQGKPDPFALVELGPGRGTLMADALRATAHVGGFHAAKNLYLVDSDEALRQKQRELLAAHAPQHINDIAEIPPLPLLVIANEFFDALPVRQFEKTFRGWSERMVTVADDALAITLRPLAETEANLLPASSRDALPGTVVEVSPQAQTVMKLLAQRLAAQKGSALIIDYGYTAPSGQATAQAISNHAPVDFFDRPGEVDLTAHVDFIALQDIARAAGLQAAPIIGQGEFLKNLGIDIRADALRNHATFQQAADIDAALHRLTDPTQMGELFKVMQISA